ncbi:MAG: SPOR domain-containing protein [Rickettsiales bacterium]|jgi:hypothetical protein|nr:SPOR domain-containing protein [Rickettsiales bacterium]
MADENEKLDLLDLEDEIELPEVDEELEVAASCSRPRKPWLLFGAALIVVILATYIIVRIVSSGTSSDSVEIDLTAPIPAAGQVAPIAPAPQQVPAPQPVPQPVPVAAAPTAQPVPAAAPVREIENRKEVVFKEVAKVEPPKPRPVAKPAPKKVEVAAAKPAPKSAQTPAAKSSNYYVQFGSYSTRSAAVSAQKKISGAHTSLFSGHSFVIQDAVLSGGKTTYRLRVGFNNSADANGFCRNAKSDGLDCYVAR